MLPLGLLVLPAAAALTVYTGQETATTTATSSSASASYTGLAAYDPTTLTPPAPPSPAMTALAVTIPADPVASGFPLSIPQKGNFLGFSIELSVADTLLGKRPTELQPNFLNYLANIQNRAGAGPVVRVGGNTQEDSTLYSQGLADGGSIDKIKVNDSTTPIINYSPLLLETMANITALVGTEWFFGLSFNETEVDAPTGNVPIAASYAQTLLGDSLRGLALGNEPDLYVDHLHREAGWTLANYTAEFAASAADIMSQGKLKTQATLVGPSVCCDVAGFELADVFNAGWLTSNIDSLAAVSVQHYPNNNCQVNGVVVNAQDIFSDYLNHTSAQSLTSPYLDGSAQTIAAGKEMVMLEMNTASCGGFAGLSDSFGAAMWMVDWALQLAYGNFTNALMHVGGQNVYYNPFTPPPSTSPSSYEWTTGSVYYSTLVVAEAFGSSNASQITDLLPSTQDMYNPAYAVYENGTLTRAVLFNYVSDATGASDYVATLSVPVDVSTVSVRYLRAASQAEQYNITWAGQTLGTSFASDGRLYGDLATETASCSNGQCAVTVPAPAIAVVYFSDAALSDSSVPAAATATYGTTIIGTGAATINPSALATSNGKNGPLGSSSEGSANSSGDARSVQLHVGLGVLALAVAFVFGTGRGL